MSYQHVILNGWPPNYVSFTVHLCEIKMLVWSWILLFNCYPWIIRLRGFFVIFVQVACPPYKVNALRAFCRILDTPIRILKDCVQMMRLELVIILYAGKMNWLHCSLFNFNDFWDSAIKIIQNIQDYMLLLDFKLMTVSSYHCELHCTICRWVRTSPVTWSGPCSGAWLSHLTPPLWRQPEPLL